MLVMGSVLAVIIGMFALYIAPEADVHAKQLKAEGIERAMVSAITPGVFNEALDGKAVYYAEEVGLDDNTLRNIFTYGEAQNREGVVIARRGYQEIDEASGDRYVILKNGSRYEGIPGNADYRMIDFETYAIRIKPMEKKNDTLYPKEMPFNDLLASDDRSHRVEIQWRLSKVAIVPILAVLALAFSSLDVRRGRLGRMMGAIAVYFFYSNMLGFGHALLKSGQVPPAVGLWWIHGLFLVLALYMMRRRTWNRPLIPGFDWLRRA
jgi:lipopolysaccharide export system permease protein